MDELLKLWHSKLLHLLYLAIALGWVGTPQWQAANEVVRSRLQVGSTGDVAKQTTQSERDEVKRLRLSCKNAMQFGMTLLMEDSLRCVFRGVVELIKPIRAWHGQALTGAKSMAGALQWYLTQARGGVLEPLCEVATKLTESHFWEQVGLWVPGPVPPTTDPDHPAALAECDCAAKVFRFGVALMGRRLRTVLWHLEGFPGSFVQVLDPDMAGEKLRAVKDLYSIWQDDVKKQKGAFWNKFRDRSVFQTASVAQVVICIMVGVRRRSGKLHETSVLATCNQHASSTQHCCEQQHITIETWLGT